jgi:hypothetical protein
LDQNPVLEKAKQIASKKQRLPFSLFSLSLILLIPFCSLYHAHGGTGPFFVGDEESGWGI